jgi:apolipoprotein N-acyltransferase
MRYLAAIFFATLASLSFEPYAIWPLALIGLAGWFALLTQNGLKYRIYLSYLFGACLLLLNQHWTGVYVGNLPWLILSLSQAVIFIMPAFFVRKGAKYNQYLFALSYVLTELLLRTVPFTGFGWTRLSFTQVDSPLAVIYSIGGVALVALVLALVSSARKFRSLVIAALIPAVCWFIPTNVQNEEPISIALVQGGVVNLGLDFNSKPQEVFKRHLDQSISSIKPKPFISLAVNFNCSAATSFLSQLRHKIELQLSGEITVYQVFSIMSVLSPTPMPNAPPLAPSPMIQMIIGTFKRIIS